jgi:hypothetical protein
VSQKLVDRHQHGFAWVTEVDMASEQLANMVEAAATRILCQEVDRLQDEIERYRKALEAIMEETDLDAAWVIARRALQLL